MPLCALLAMKSSLRANSTHHAKEGREAGRQVFGVRRHAGSWRARVWEGVGVRREVGGGVDASMIDRQDAARLVCQEIPNQTPATTSILSTPRREPATSSPAAAPTHALPPPPLSHFYLTALCCCCRPSRASTALVGIPSPRSPDPALLLSHPAAPHPPAYFAVQGRSSITRADLQGTGTVLRCLVCRLPRRSRCRRRTKSLSRPYDECACTCTVGTQRESKRLHGRLRQSATGRVCAGPQQWPAHGSKGRGLCQHLRRQPGHGRALADDDFAATDEDARPRCDNVFPDLRHDAARAPHETAHQWL